MTSRYPGACPAPAVSVVLSVYRNSSAIPTWTNADRTHLRRLVEHVSRFDLIRQRSVVQVRLLATPGDIRPNGPEQLDDHRARVKSTTSLGVGTPLPSSASSRPIAASDPSSNSPPKRVRVTATLWWPAHSETSCALQPATSPCQRGADIRRASKHRTAQLRGLVESRPARARTDQLGGVGEAQARLTGRLGDSAVDQSGLVGGDHQVGAVADAELVQQPADMGLGSRGRHVQGGADLDVGQASGDSREDLNLSCRQ